MSEKIENLEIIYNAKLDTIKVLKESIDPSEGYTISLFNVYKEIMDSKDIRIEILILQKEQLEKDKKELSLELESLKKKIKPKKKK